MIANNSQQLSKRIVIEVIAGIPEYLVQRKKRILFYYFWSTEREKKFFMSRKIRFDSIEKAKDFIKARYN